MELPRLRQARPGVRVPKWAAFTACRWHHRWRCRSFRLQTFGVFGAAVDGALVRFEKYGAANRSPEEGHTAALKDALAAEVRLDSLRLLESLAVGKRRKGPPQPEPPDDPAYLTRPRDQVDAHLEERMSIGRKLLKEAEDGQTLWDLDRANDLKAKYGNWRRYNHTYLERSFTNGKPAQGYSYLGIGGIASGYGDPAARIAKFLIEDLKDYLKWLEGLREQLPLYEPPTGSAVVRQSEPPQPVSPIAEYNIKMTFEGQVGQINFAELMERIHNEVSVVDKRGEGKLASALTTLTQTIASSRQIDEDRRAEALDAVSVLAEVGAKPPEERGRFLGRVKGMVALIGEVAKVAPEVQKAWDQVGPTVTEHFPKLLGS